MNEAAAIHGRILTCDDNVEFAERVCIFLRHKGCMSDQAPNVPAAREKIESEDYDLFLLYIVMPGTSRKVLCREIASRFDAGIIMISSIDDVAKHINPRHPLVAQHLNLPKLRDNLFRLETLDSHFRSSFS